MLGASRASLTEVRQILGDSSVSAVVGEEVLAVATLLAGQPALRGTLADPGAPAEQRAATIGQLVTGKISPAAVELVQQVVVRRWSSGGDLVEALGILGAEALLINAESDGRLDAVQNQVFDFARTVAANGDLQLVLGDPAVPGDQRAAVVESLVGGRVEAETLVLLRDVVQHPRGRRLDDALEELVELAAVRRQELLAQVRSAVSLTPEQVERLSNALARVYGQPVRIQSVVDPEVVGGVSVTVGDEVIDGTTVHRLEQARRLLVGGKA